MTDPSDAGRAGERVRVGYADPVTDVEYGVFLDRTAKGLGYALLTVTRRHDWALKSAAKATGEITFIRQRLVTRSPWTTPTDPEATL